MFGSVLHGTDTEASDLDLLVEPGPDFTLLGLCGIRAGLLALLSVPVDVATPGPFPPTWRHQVLAEARPI